MTATAAPIPFAGSTLGGYRHVCAFFSSAQEEYDTLLPFVRDGLERGERAYHVLPSQYREEHLEQLRSAGIDVAAGATLGFPLTRLIAHAETVLWHPEDWSSVNEWIEYETRLNDVLPRYDDPVICTYDANLLNGSIAVDILRTHPVAIIGGLLYENPFFVPPQQFLRQVLQRSGAPPKPYRG